MPASTAIPIFAFTKSSTSTYITFGSSLYEIPFSVNIVAILDIWSNSNPVARGTYCDLDKNNITTTTTTTKRPPAASPIRIFLSIDWNNVLIWVLTLWNSSATYTPLSTTTEFSLFPYMLREPYYEFLRQNLKTILPSEMQS